MTPGKPVSVAILAAWAADLATPSFGTGMPQASHASLPSGAVRLVRLSALTESRILRTASLEFDIGFLLERQFLGSSAACADFRTIACALQSPIPRLPRHQARSPSNPAGMAFVMPETELSRRPKGGKC